MVQIPEVSLARAAVDQDIIVLRLKPELQVLEELAAAELFIEQAPVEGVHARGIDGALAAGRHEDKTPACREIPVEAGQEPGGVRRCPQPLALFRFVPALGQFIGTERAVDEILNEVDESFGFSRSGSVRNGWK